MGVPGQQFHSPTLGSIQIDKVVERIQAFVADSRERDYRLIIGTDSLPNIDGQVYLVTAIVLHRVGNGGIYFWQRILSSKLHTLRDRMYAEAMSSITMAQFLENQSGLQHTLRESIEIHVDVGEAGPTRAMIQELVGMIVAHGYAAKTKPESFAASKVADRHTVPGPKLVLARQPIILQ